MITQIVIDRDLFQTRRKMQLSPGDKKGIILAVVVLVIAILAHFACKFRLVYNRMAEVIEPDVVRLQEITCKPSTSDN